MASNILVTQKQYDDLERYYAAIERTKAIKFYAAFGAYGVATFLFGLSIGALVW